MPCKIKGLKKGIGCLPFEKNFGLKISEVESFQRMTQSKALSCLKLAKYIHAEVRVQKTKELRAKSNGKIINVIVEITKMSNKGKVKRLTRCYHHQGQSADK